MRVTIGKKKFWIPDPTIPFLEDNIFENIQKYTSWKLKYFIDNYYKPIPVSDTWLKGIDMNTYIVNAEYNSNKNEIIIKVNFTCLLSVKFNIVSLNITQINYII